MKIWFFQLKPLKVIVVYLNFHEFRKTENLYTFKALTAPNFHAHEFKKTKNLYTLMHWQQKIPVYSIAGHPKIRFWINSSSASTSFKNNLLKYGKFISLQVDFKQQPFRVNTVKDFATKTLWGKE